MLELLITVAIIGIIAGVAFPAYNENTRKGHRAAVQGHMMDIASRQGEILADSNAYAANTEMIALLPTPTTIAAKYTVSTALGSGTNPTFVITATPVVGSAQAADGVLTLSSSGAKTPAGKW